MFDKKCGKTNVYDACAAWYETPAGTYALQQLDNKIENYLSKIFGYYALEMGALVGRHHFLDKSRVSTCFSLGHASYHHENNTKRAEQKIELTAEAALPIDFDSVDLVLASHVLECACNPHQVLREIDRILIPEGQCLFINFNALALWGGHRAFCNQADKTVKPYGLYRIRDWFSVLGWEVLDVSYVSFRSSYLKGKTFERLLKLEKWGSLYWPIFSNITIIHAKKHALIMPPAKQKRRKAGIIVPTNVGINPASRSSHYCDQTKKSL